MPDVNETLTAPDLARLADLHVDAIEDSVPSFLGRSYTRLMYRFLAASQRERILIERVDGRIASACVVSFDPNSLQRRMASTTLPSLLFHAVIALVRRYDFRQYVMAVLRDALRGGAEQFSGPEIVYVFTDAALRGAGLGQKLIERTDALMRSRGESNYFVQTIDEPGNRAIAFYENAGFVRIGDRHERGRRFALFLRKLDPRS